MCSEGWYEECDVELYCIECGAQVDEDGDALERCFWSQVDCEVCGSAPCDGSC